MLNLKRSKMAVREMIDECERVEERERVIESLLTILSMMRV